MREWHVQMYGSIYLLVFMFIYIYLYLYLFIYTHTYIYRKSGLIRRDSKLFRVNSFGGKRLYKVGNSLRNKGWLKRFFGLREILWGPALGLKPRPGSRARSLARRHGRTIPASIPPAMHAGWNWPRPINLQMITWVVVRSRGRWRSRSQL